MNHQEADTLAKAYGLARERFKALGIDTEEAIRKADAAALSIHCWQGDDVSGFETSDARLSDGGIQVSGNYPGKARNADELRSDLDLAFSAIPGAKRLNLHAIYAEHKGRRVERDQLTVDQFEGWIAWAEKRGAGLDFNPTFFSHPRSKSGFTLSSADDSTRRFWIEHGKACRRIGEQFGKRLGTPCITNFWIPDGSKDTPADRGAPRARLRESLDEIFREQIDPRYNLDALESKLFGIGSESYVVGSHEFYLGYAIQNDKVVCLDMGHFHPTESVADKISSLLTFVPRLLFHVSRGVRWDSDHVVVANDDLLAVARELAGGNYLDRVSLALDFFDATINRCAAWIIGARALRQSLLRAFCEPVALMKAAENAGDFTARLALQHQCATLPFGAVWDWYCVRENAGLEQEWPEKVRQYESSIAASRGAPS